MSTPALVEAVRALDLDCSIDVLNPCWNGRATDIVGQHWGGGAACPQCIVRALTADSLASAVQGEREMPEFADPEDQADQLSERSANIGAARDHAFELGIDEYAAGTDRDAHARRRFTHPTLIGDYCSGWDTAALDAAVARQQEGA